MLHHGPISLRAATRRRGGTVEWKVDASLDGMEVGAAVVALERCALRRNSTMA
jgi:hypothetical protein